MPPSTTAMSAKTPFQPANKMAQGANDQSTSVPSISKHGKASAPIHQVDADRDVRFRTPTESEEAMASKAVSETRDTIDSLYERCNGKDKYSTKNIRCCRCREDHSGTERTRHDRPNHIVLIKEWLRKEQRINLAQIGNMFNIPKGEAPSLATWEIGQDEVGSLPQSDRRLHPDTTAHMAATPVKDVVEEPGSYRSQHEQGKD